MKPFDVEAVRRHFPALQRELNGRPVLYLDGPAGSQVPVQVADAMRRYLLHENANTHGRFPTSQETDRRILEARRAAADLLGVDDPDLIVFGPNMTTLTFSLSRSIGRTLGPGDEILVTDLDHDANITPWVMAAEDAGATVRRVAVRTEDCTLDLEDLASKLTPRTKLVAVGAASNAAGTVNPVGRIADLVHDAGALLFVDAVHYAPHLCMDAKAWGADFVVCSAYKFFGPHIGFLWGRREHLTTLPAYRVRPAGDELPERWMTGTQSHEAIAGAEAAIDYLANVGRAVDPQRTERRDALMTAFDAIATHERRLSRRFLDGLSTIPRVKVHGIADTGRLEERVPTFSITHARLRPAELAERLAEDGIFVWDGNFYALALSTRLGLEPDGMVRIGLLHYSTPEEVDRLLERLAGF